MSHRSQHQVEAILARRAEAMARRERSEEAKESVSIVTFTLAGYAIGVPLGNVAFVGEIQQLSEIPGAPPYLIGAIVSRGRVVSLLDLALFLPLKRLGGGDITGAVTLTHGGRELGLAAEELLGIEDVDSSAISATYGLPAPIPKLVRVGERNVLLLAPDILLGDRRLGRSD